MKGNIILRWKDSNKVHKEIRKKYKEIYDNIIKVTDILDDRNYILIIKENSKKDIDIILEINGKSFSLKEKYLPKGYRFISGDKFTTRSSFFDDIEINNFDKQEKDYTVTFDKKAINNKYFLLRLLHELGHANDLESNKKLRNIIKEKEGSREVDRIKDVNIMGLGRAKIHIEKIVIY